MTEEEKATIVTPGRSASCVEYEVAENPTSRSLGLMGRMYLCDDNGFVEIDRKRWCLQGTHTQLTTIDSNRRIADRDENNMKIHGIISKRKGCRCNKIESG